VSPLSGNREGGWEFNSERFVVVGYDGEDYPIWGPMSPGDAATISEESLRQEPSFRHFDDDEILGDSGSDFLLQGETNIKESAIYRRLMADAIPALSDAAGGNGLGMEPRDGGFQQDIFKAVKDLSYFKRGNFASGNWPRKTNRWLHSDIKVIAYPYNHRAFDAIVRSMETGSLE